MNAQNNDMQRRSVKPVKDLLRTFLFICCQTQNCWKAPAKVIDDKSSLFGGAGGSRNMMEFINIAIACSVFVYGDRIDLTTK